MDIETGELIAVFKQSKLTVDNIWSRSCFLLASTNKRFSKRGADVDAYAKPKAFHILQTIVNLRAVDIIVSEARHSDYIRTESLMQAMFFQSELERLGARGLPWTRMRNAVLSNDLLEARGLG